LPDQLIHPLFGHCAGALFVNVNSVSRAGRLSIDQDANLTDVPSAAGPMTR
jgi:hypothetical protein